MSRVPHLPQVLQGPLAARPAAEQTPDWVWYFAWDDDGGAFYRPTPQGWVKATPSVGASPWQDLAVVGGWTPLAGAPPQFRRHHGVVELRGGVSRAGGPFPIEVATLPAGYRPTIEVRFPVATGQGLSTVSIAPNGVVTVHGPAAAGDAGTNVHLDPVRFAAAE